MTDLCWLILVCASTPALLFFWNCVYFRRPHRIPSDSPRVSVLIPARNEEGSIGGCLEAALASEHVTLEVIVLDDHSTDRTAGIVREMAQSDARVRLANSSELPEGWCGKQFACFQLSKLASYEYLAFLDADVRLSKEGLAKLIGFQQDRNVPLVSAFPRQIMVSWMELMIIPMINFMLLCYLPMWGMRHLPMPGFGAGCGQLFLATRRIYELIGGHSLVKESMHDGLKLPRAYRKASYFTDLCDGSEIACCRMYRNASQVWNGFVKNAREGIAKPPLIFVFSILLSLAFILPGPLLLILQDRLTADQTNILALAFCLSFLPRILLTGGKARELLGALFHPVSVFLFLSIQWYANYRYWIGQPVGWKGRIVESPEKA